MTTKSLAAPSWSSAKLISGTDTFQPNLRGPIGVACNTGFNSGNYVSIIDDASPGYNFEFTNGSPWLFYVINSDVCPGGNNMDRDLNRVPLTITYD